MIEPTIGRVVLYREYAGQKEPYAAQIAFVQTPRCINIGYLNHAGLHRSATGVTLIQEGDEVPKHAYAEWMPYQKAVASGKQAPAHHA